MLRIVVLLVELPHRLRADPEPLSDRRLVIKDTVFDTVRFARIVEHETLVVFCTGIHHLTEHVERRKNAKERLVKSLAILNHILTQDEHVVDVGAQVR